VTVEAEVVEAGVVMGIDGVGGGCCRRAWRHRSTESCVSAMSRRGRT